MVAQAVYDGTVLFGNRFIERRSRTHDQMVQAARSGVRNISEGSLASATSKKTELKLTGVARASLGELIGDYEDYLVQNRLRIWEKDSRLVRLMRARLAGKLKKPGWPDKSDLSDRSDRPRQAEREQLFDEPLRSALKALESAPAEQCANILLCLAHQASYLLNCQLRRLEKDFLENGGFTERLYHCRKEQRGAATVKGRPPVRSDPSDQSE